MMKVLRQSHPPHPVLSVFVSPAQILDMEFRKILKMILSKAIHSPNSLKVEPIYQKFKVTNMNI